MCLFNINNVHAKNATFYEGEYIDGIYLNKYRYDNQTIYFQKARFFRKTGTNEFAYCIEPFRFFEDGNNYTETVTPNNLTETQKHRIKLIAHFGYGYKNHTDKKWYAITQYMIWKETTNNIGEVYFTDTLNGNRVNYFTNEINEIENLIKSYEELPLPGSRIYRTFEGYPITIWGKSSMKFYNTNEKDIRIEGSNIITKNYEKEGTYKYKIYREDKAFNKPIIFYQSANSQNLMETGDLEKKELDLTIIVIKARIYITKVDKDTLQLTPQGDASLDGAIYEVFDSDNDKMGEIEIKNNKGFIKITNYGTYYVKEKSPGTGYLKDENTYEVKITVDNIKQTLTLTNKVIEKKIKIKKEFGEGNNFIGEKDIEFEIYNSKDELIKTVITNEQGEVSFTLPYGEYKVVQITTTNGYTKVDPFNIEVKDTEDKLIELKDYKIPVPDTHTGINLLSLFFRFITIILC